MRFQEGERRDRSQVVISWSSGAKGRTYISLGLFISRSLFAPDLLPLF